MTEALTLVKPHAALEASARGMRAEFIARDGRDYTSFLPFEDETFVHFLRRLVEQEAEDPRRPGMVPQTIFWLVRNGTEVVGQSALRHYLTPALEIEGGHIGYAIHPDERCKGYGTHILAFTMVEARRIGLRRVLVTCNTENIGSARIIRKNGGVFEGEDISPYTGKPVSRYWIEL